MTIPMPDKSNARTKSALHEGGKWLDGEFSLSTTHDIFSDRMQHDATSHFQNVD